MYSLVNDLSNKAIETTINYALSSSFGYGGNHAVLACKKFE